MVSYGGYRNAVGEDYLATVAQYDSSRPIVDDINTMIKDVNRFEVSIRLRCLLPRHSLRGPSYSVIPNGLTNKLGAGPMFRITSCTIMPRTAATYSSR